MPFYVGDYLGDTSHLSTIEHGAYMLLLMHYWSHGGLPDNEKQLARIVRMTNQEWRSAKPVLAAFFGKKWTHKRVKVELDRAARYSERQRKAALTRYAKKDDGELRQNGIQQNSTKKQPTFETEKPNGTKDFHAVGVPARAYQTRPYSISNEIESEAAPRRAREKRTRSPPDFTTFLQESTCSSAAGKRP